MAWWMLHDQKNGKDKQRGFFPLPALVDCMPILYWLSPTATFSCWRTRLFRLFGTGAKLWHFSRTFPRIVWLTNYSNRRHTFLVPIIYYYRSQFRPVVHSQRVFQKYGPASPIVWLLSDHPHGGSCVEYGLQWFRAFWKLQNVAVRMMYTSSKMMQVMRLRNHWRRHCFGCSTKA